MESRSSRTRHPDLHDELRCTIDLALGDVSGEFKMIHISSRKMPGCILEPLMVDSSGEFNMIHLTSREVPPFIPKERLMQLGKQMPISGVSLGVSVCKSECVVVIHIGCLLRPYE